MKRPKMFAVLPTMLTLGNAACGFGALTIAAKVGPEPLANDNTPLLVAGLLIFLAMLCDMLDGSAARWTNQTSEFGAQLDSLCDAISFGVAPAFIMLKFSRDVYHPRFLWVIGVLFVVCAVLRLARFNVETEEDDSHEYFSGLPSPAAAGLVASFPIAVRGLDDASLRLGTAFQDLSGWLLNAVQFALPFLTLSVACLMVSRVRYPHVFNQLFRGQRNRVHVIQLVFTLAIVFVVRELAVPLIFCYFAFSGPLRLFGLEVLGRRLHKSTPI